MALLWTGGCVLRLSWHLVHTSVLQHCVRRMHALAGSTLLHFMTKCRGNAVQVYIRAHAMTTSGTSTQLLRDQVAHQEAALREGIVRAVTSAATQETAQDDSGHAAVLEQRTAATTWPPLPPALQLKEEIGAGAQGTVLYGVQGNTRVAVKVQIHRAAAATFVLPCLGDC